MKEIMFNETDNAQAQYCPMCEEWAEKYEEQRKLTLQQQEIARDYWECLEKIREIVKDEYTANSHKFFKIEEFINEVLGND